MQQNHKKNIFTTMSKGEKIFWGTILIFFIIYLTLHLVGYIRTTTSTNKVEPIIEKYVLEFFPTDKIFKNLDKNQSIINQHLNQKMILINTHIDNKVDKLFSNIDNNIETFLDVHYSVVGEYAELSAMASNSLAQKIKKQIFGDDFEQNYHVVINSITDEYKETLNEHTNLVTKIGLQGIDTNLNTNSLTILQQDIENFQLNFEAKASLLTLGLGTKLITTLATKVAGKAGAKLTGKAAIKGSAKLAAKEVAATGAAATGALCGPFVWICSPVGATIAWFATDAVVVTADESLNRKKLKRELLSSIKQGKENLKAKLKKSIQKGLQKASEVIQTKLKQTPIIEKKKVLIIDKISKGFKTLDKAREKAQENIDKVN